MPATDPRFGEFLEAYFSDEDIAEGMPVVASIAKDDPDFHQEVLAWLNDAIAKLRGGEYEVLRQLARGNFAAAQNPESANRLVELLRDKYLQAYFAAKTTR